MSLNPPKKCNVALCFACTCPKQLYKVVDASVVLTAAPEKAEMNLLKQPNKGQVLHLLPGATV